jgi:type IV secretory pathway TrbD component
VIAVSRTWKSIKRKLLLSSADAGAVATGAVFIGFFTILNFFAGVGVGIWRVSVEYNTIIVLVLYSFKKSLFQFYNFV